MPKRGRKPGSYSPLSFVGKLRSLKPGESLMLDDYAGGNAATRLEREFHSQCARSPALEGLSFTARRVRWIDGDTLARALRITRTE